MAYVDSWVMPVPKGRLDEYKSFSRRLCHLWLENGATGFVEVEEDDVAEGQLTSFRRAVVATPDEVVVVGWVTYPSREVRDAANKTIMDHADMQMDPADMPMDGKRMFFGGFTPFIEHGPTA